MSRDSIVGHWNPKTNDLPNLGHLSVDDDLSYLSGDRRITILAGEILSAFSVRKNENDDGNVVGASLWVTPEADVSLGVEKQEICKIVKPSDEDLQNQMCWLRSYADLRGDRISEITEQAGGILAFYGSIGHLNNSRRKASWELLAIVQSVCVALEMRIKHYCWAQRPIEYASEVQPLIQTPDHSTYPSGHATEAFALAVVMNHLMTKNRLHESKLNENAPMPLRLAHRIAVNRTVAGVHYPLDSAAGAMLGCAIGEAIIAFAKNQKLQKTQFGEGDMKLTDQASEKNEDFTLKWFVDKYNPTEGAQVAKLDLLSIAYERAANEWS